MAKIPNPALSRLNARYACPAWRARATDAAFATALAAGLITVALLFGALFYWSDRVDDANRQHEIRLTENGIQAATREIEDSLTPVTQWDDSVRYLDNHFDPVWAASNIGAFLDQTLDMDGAVLLDASDAPIFARRRQRAVSLGGLRQILAAAGPSVETVRQREAAQRLIAAPGDGTIITIPIRATASALLDGKPYLLTASLIQPDFGTALPKGSRAPIVISIVTYDTVFADVSSDYQLQGARLEAGAAQLQHDQAGVPIVGHDGRPVATLVWSPQRPGQHLLEAALPFVAAAALLLGGGLLALMGFLRANLRSLRRVMAQVVDARDAAEAANDAKSRFLATMSHEIRTPLNGILGMAQIMQMGDLGAEQNQRVGVIKDSGQSLLAILNDVLDLSKIEAGGLELETTPFSLIELTDGACAAFAAIAQAKGLAFSVAVSDEALGVWRGDPLRLRQILFNLISNAVKFTERGGVTVTISAPLREGGRWLALRVADTGIGIAAEALPTVFDKFVQTDSSHSRRYGGTGLGLAICRDLSRLMGGTVRAQSVPGEGSVFMVELPLAWIDPDPITPQAPPSAEDGPVGGLRILVAEDNATNRLVLKTLLESVGLIPVMVENGLAAVEAWRAATYDLVLMDVQMPGMDGVEATRQIRALEAGGARRTPIVAVTANAMKHQVAEYFAAGFDAHLAKPIEVAKLYEVLSMWGDEIAPESGDRMSA